MNNEINFEEFIKNIDCTIYEKIDVDNWNISVEVVLDVVEFLQRSLEDMRTYIVNHPFSNKEEEIYFFKHINASIFNWFGYTGTTLGLMFGEFSYIVAFVLFLCLSFLFVFLSRILLHRTCRDIQRVSAEKFHWKPELLTLLCSTLLIGVCLFGIRGRK